MKKFVLALAAAAVLASAPPALAGESCCGVAQAGPPKEGCCIGDITRAVAVIHPTQGNQVTGVVWFTQEPDGKVKVVADLQGLPPNTEHGFHIHEFGDCTAADGTSAGGHYNPEGHAHAGPDTAVRHAGDLGNVTSDGEGKVHYELTVDNMSICGMKSPILGRGVIVHAKKDDLKTQPTGDAGGRIGCGVIGVARPGDR